MKERVSKNWQAKRAGSETRANAGAKAKIQPPPMDKVRPAASAEARPPYQTLSGLRVSVKAHIEAAFRLANGLLLAGWVFDPDVLVRGYCLFDRDAKVPTHDLFETESGSRFYRLPRPDVSASHPGVFASGDDHGFLAYVPLDGDEATQFALALKSGALAVVEHALDRTAQEAAGHLRPSLKILADPLRRLAAEIPEVGDFVARYLPLPPPERGIYDSDEDAETGLGRPSRVRDGLVPAVAKNALPLSEEAKSISISVDLALEIYKGVLVIGWIWDPKQAVRDWGLGEAAGQSGYVSAASHKQGVFYRRTLRPDVATTFESERGRDDWCGFVLYITKERVGFDSLVVRTRTAETVAVPLAISNDVWGAWGKFEAGWAHSGAAIRQLALIALPEKHAMREWLEDFAASQSSRTGVPLAVVEKGVIIEDAILLLEGWMSLAKGDIASLELWQGSEHHDLLPGLLQTPRPDVAANLSLPPDARPGYVSICRINRDLLGSFRLRLKARDGRVQVLFLRPGPVDLRFLMPTLVSAWDDADKIEEQIAAITVGLDVAKRMRHLQAQAFASRYKDLQTFVENPLLGAAAVDRGIPLDEGGLLVFGWNFSVHDKPRSIAVLTPEGDRLQIAERMFALPRTDVKQSFGGRFPQVPEACGFVVHVPLPTAPGALRMLEYDFGEAGKIWQKIPTDKPGNSGVALVREIMQWIPAPERIGSRLGALLRDCIAPAVEGVVAKARASNPVSPVERQFGVAPANPLASIVVPLYGRYDYLRHQIAHFVDDADFRAIDLIYVLDDPAIEYETLITAARVHAFFGLPFRVVSYGRNLGFGGANNIGAQFAASQNLVLLNSDVLPIGPGWVSGLATALKTLPSAKAVAPLLLFHDGMVQHAGMTNGPSSAIDGLLLNRHPGKGLPWDGGDTERAVDLLTAACIMLRTGDYRQAGGFDESFIVGDYEDSDLCRRLVGEGDLLYLVPRFKLWHLERQTQAIGAGTSQRMLITVMNGMRYSKRQAVPEEK